MFSEVSEKVAQLQTTYGVWWFTFSEVQVSYLCEISFSSSNRCTPQFSEGYSLRRCYRKCRLYWYHYSLRRKMAKNIFEGSPNSSQWRLRKQSMLPSFLNCEAVLWTLVLLTVKNQFGVMEVTRVERIFNRLVSTYGVSYTKYLGDRDSKAYSSVAQSQPKCWNTEIWVSGISTDKNGHSLEMLKWKKFEYLWWQNARWTQSYDRCCYPQNHKFLLVVY